MHRYIYKIVSADLWHEASKGSSFTGAGIDIVDGFIHFSTAQQVRKTAELYFAGQENLVLVEVAADKLGEALVYEPSRNGDLFPHLYGALAFSAVDRVLPLPLDEHGRHVFPGDLA